MGVALVWPPLSPPLQLPEKFSGYSSNFTCFFAVGLIVYKTFIKTTCFDEYRSRTEDSLLNAMLSATGKEVIPYGVSTAVRIVLQEQSRL